MSILSSYYAAMSQDKSAAAGLADAQERQTQAQTNEVAANATTARNATDTQTRLAAPLAQSEIGLRNQQAGLAGSEAGVNVERTQGLKIANKQSLLGLNPLDSFGMGYGVALDGGLLTPGTMQTSRATSAGSSGATAVSPLPSVTTPSAYPPPTYRTSSVVGGFARGTSDVSVPQKPGKTDTISAKLSPGESVLNRGATEHLGSGIIDHLNKLGMMRMAAQDEVAKHAAAIDGHSVSSVLKDAVKQSKKKASARA